jgi:multicomponent Na+:H+ antiporter subunit G
MSTLAGVLIAATMILGTFLVVVASVGLVRFPDVFCRMHAAGKAGTMGISLIIVSSVICFAGVDNSILVRGLLAIFFQFLTTPTATHLLARSSYIRNYSLTDRTVVDELQAMLPSTPDETYVEE